eukprot:999630-Rhodomonas_salina.1
MTLPSPAKRPFFGFGPSLPPLFLSSRGTPSHVACAGWEEVRGVGATEVRSRFGTTGACFGTALRATCGGSDSSGSVTRRSRRSWPEFAAFRSRGGCGPWNKTQNPVAAYPSSVPDFPSTHVGP